MAEQKTPSLRKAVHIFIDQGGGEACENSSLVVPGEGGIGGTNPTIHVIDIVIVAMTTLDVIKFEEHWGK